MRTRNDSKLVSQRRANYLNHKLIMYARIYRARAGVWSSTDVPSRKNMADRKMTVDKMNDV